MTNQTRMMTDYELEKIEYRLELCRNGDPNALQMLDLADLLTDARLARELIAHLHAELRMSTGVQK